MAYALGEKFAKIRYFCSFYVITTLKIMKINKNQTTTFYAQCELSISGFRFLLALTSLEKFEPVVWTWRAASASRGAYVRKPRSWLESARWVLLLVEISEKLKHQRLPSLNVCMVFLESLQNVCSVLKSVSKSSLKR